MNRRRFEWLWLREAFKQEWPHGVDILAAKLFIAFVGIFSSLVVVTLAKTMGLLFMGALLLGVYVFAGFLQPISPQDRTWLALSRLLIWIIVGAVIASFAGLETYMLDILKP